MTAKPITLIHSSVVDTDGDSPCLVSMMPCTIHGWRPLSVRHQPAVLIRNGSTAPQVATQRKREEVASFPRRLSHRPQTPIRNTTMARYAITRMPQYWMNTLGT